MSALVEPLSDVISLRKDKKIITITNSRVYPPKVLRELEEKFSVLYPSSPYSPMGKKEMIINSSISDGVLVSFYDQMDKEALDEISAKGKCKIMVVFSTGFEHVDAEYAESKGILVCNTPGKFTEATADITISLILNSTRNTFFAENSLRNGNFPGFFSTMGMSLSEKDLGLIGFGRIGKEVSKRAQSFGMNVSYYKRNRLAENVEKKHKVVYKPLDELLSSSDIVSLHIPMAPGNEGYFDKEKFSKMKNGAYFINTARGKLVDEDALVEALESGNIAGCGLDVFEGEPKVHPNLLKAEKGVTLYPHIGASTREAYVYSIEQSMKNFELSLLENKPVLTAVNKPEWYEKILEVNESKN